MEAAEIQYYNRLADLALEAGEIMIRSGAETSRVEDTMSRLLGTSGFSYSAFVLPTGIMVTLTDSSIPIISITRRVFPGSTDLGKICDVNTVSRGFCAGKISLEEAENRLKAIRNSNRYSVFIKTIGTMLGCAGFTTCFGGGFAEFILGFICGFFLSLETYLLRRYIRKNFLADVLGAIVSTFISILLSFFVGRYIPVVPTVLISSVIAGCIMPLVPGVSITNAIRDIFAGDYLSGASRIIEAFLVALSIAIGVGVGIASAKELGLTNGINFEGGTVSYWQCIGAFIAAFGFALIFQIPKKFILPSGIGGVLCWAAYVSGLNVFGLSFVWAVFFATLLVDLYAQLCARILRSPVIIYLISGIVLLVPGFNIYQAVYYLLEGDSERSGTALSQTFLIAGAIALAVFFMDAVIAVIFQKKSIGEKVRDSVSHKK